MLSGFVLAHAYEQRLATGQMEWRDFVLVRLIRLYPLVLVSTVIGGVVLLLGELHKTHRIDLLVDVPLYFGAALLLPTGLYRHSQAYPLNGPVWSLFFELAVSLVYGSTLGRLDRSVMVRVVAVCAFCLVISAILWDGPFGDIGFASPLSFLLGFARVSYPFWIGVALCRFGSWKQLPSLSFLVLCLILSAILLTPFGGKIFALTAILFVFPAVVTVGSSTKVSAGMGRACSILGELSYPVYLLNQPVFRIIKNLQVLRLSGVPPAGSIILGMLLTIVGSQFLVVVDRPVRQWLTLKLRKRRETPRSSSAA